MANMSLPIPFHAHPSQNEEEIVVAGRTIQKSSFSESDLDLKSFRFLDLNAKIIHRSGETYQELTLIPTTQYPVLNYRRNEDGSVEFTRQEAADKPIQKVTAGKDFLEAASIIVGGSDAEFLATLQQRVQEDAAQIQQMERDRKLARLAKASGLGYAMLHGVVDRNGHCAALWDPLAKPESSVPRVFCDGAEVKAIQTVPLWNKIALHTEHLSGALREDNARKSVGFFQPAQLALPYNVKEKEEVIASLALPKTSTMIVLHEAKDNPVCAAVHGDKKAKPCSRTK